MIPPERKNVAPQAPDWETSEAQARQSLGIPARTVVRSPQLRPDQVRQRHRFVQDGECPVVVLNSLRDRGGVADRQVQAAQAALAAERTARADSERSLRDAEATIKYLQTQLAHAELARGEALATEQAARVSMASALREADETIESLRSELARIEPRHSEALAKERRAREHAESALEETVAAEKQSRKRRPRKAVLADRNPARKGKAATGKSTVRKKIAKKAPGTGRRGLQPRKGLSTGRPVSSKRKTAATRNTIPSRASKTPSRPKAADPQPVKWWALRGRTKKER